jgi:hypothetical protein
MRELTRFAVLVSLVSLTVSARAQSLDQYDRVLLPLTPEHVSGAFGSEWVTDIAMTNLSDSPLAVIGYGTCFFLCPSPPPIPAHATIFVTQTPRCSEVRGTFLFVERGRVRDLAMTLRSRELSRQLQTWGSTIPVVTADKLFGQRFSLVDVPMEPQFRSTLRIYDFNAATPATVRLRFYGIDPTRDLPRDSRADTLLLETTPTFTIPTTGGGTATCPGFFEMSLSSLPALAGAQRVRVEVEPLDGTSDYWGFVSVTHNDTQHVTVITPK